MKNNSKLPFSEFISDLEYEVSHTEELVSNIKQIYSLYKNELSKNEDLRKENDLLRSLISGQIKNENRSN